MAAKQRTNNNLTQLMILLVAVIVVVVASVGFQHWWNSRPTDISAMEVTVTTDDGETVLSPYAVCELGADCAVQDPTIVPIKVEETASLKVPREVKDSEWKLLLLYDNPAASSEQVFAPGEIAAVNIPGSVEPLADNEARPTLLVAEVTAVIVGVNDAGEESPYSVTWALHTVDELPEFDGAVSSPAPETDRTPASATPSSATSSE
ncbi:DUF2771 family protein [Corynebacterium choanae]|uniref:DUF2771 domain-containing protein n=1 Tax=Corynebacterium choanae TaxID=1862358 RepID=A0A3G6J5I9_9CORY|nr:DUF2771 family protein [Corynebacterium choanae]AZA13023.1 hypothetical protein CCHOA_03050 [Corynebacterium choanae]